MKIPSFYKIKKIILLFMTGTMPILFYMMMLMIMRDLNMALLFGMLIMVVMVAVSNRLLRHAFSGFIENTGITSLFIDSTGVIATFISVIPGAGKIKGFLGKKKVVEDIYERDLVYTLLVPQNATCCKAKIYNNATGVIEGECDVLRLPDSSEKFNQLFNMESRPCFVYNRNLDMYVTKGFLSKLETGSSRLHQVHHLVRVTQDTSEDVGNVAKAYVETTRPKKSWLAGKMKWILLIAIVAMLLIIGVFVLPQMLNGFKGGLAGLFGGH